MSISGPTHLAPELRPDQNKIDSWVRGAMLQRANFVLNCDEAAVANSLRAYGTDKFVSEFVEYAKAYGWAIEPNDTPYLKFMANKLPN